MTRHTSLFAATAAGLLLAASLALAFEIGHRSAYQYVDALGHQIMACEDALGEAWEAAESNGIAAPAWVAAEVSR